MIWKLHYAFNRQFERLRDCHAPLLDWSLGHSKMVLAGFMLGIASASAPVRAAISLPAFTRIKFLF